jgi:hypothetical protein
VRKVQDTAGFAQRRYGLSIPDGGGRLPLESVAAFAWNGGQACHGISGSFCVERVAGSTWNQWQVSPGIGGSFAVEYATLELLDLLLDQIPTVSLCALLTCRPTFQPPWSSRSYVTQVTLSRLAQPQLGRMAEHVAGGKRLPAEVLRQIVEKTDGVPLFVEEMTKAVLESGILQDVHGHYELTGSVSAFAIPATLHDSLMARLDRLVTAKAVAQYAAVIGRQCSYALLHAVSQVDEPTLQRELGRLVAAELLYQRGLPPQATYLFKHALIRDIAYESLLRSTRQGYHQRVATVLEAQFPEIAPNPNSWRSTARRRGSPPRRSGIGTKRDSTPSNAPPMRKPSPTSRRDSPSSRPCRPRPSAPGKNWPSRPP